MSRVRGSKLTYAQRKELVRHGFKEEDLKNYMMIGIVHGRKERFSDRPPERRDMWIIQNRNTGDAEQIEIMIKY